MTLSLILIATFGGAAISLGIAAWLTMDLMARLVRQLVSLSAGFLLGSSILHMLPEAFESGADFHGLAWALLLGIVGFFVLEKFAILRHSHHHEGDGHDHHHGHDQSEAGPGGMVILMGDAIHNFVDGVLIAGAFLTDWRLGWITTLAILAHEIPQEVGDFIVLLNAGYSRARAFLFNAIAGGAGVLGGLAGYFALQASRDLLPYAVMVAAASFIYIALADLVPDMQRQRKTPESMVQLGLMAVGVAVMAVMAAFMHAH
jgi:zinc and cadmium transporter